jgi:predicted amidohydrolase
MLRGMAEEHGLYTLSSMLVGFEGGKGLSGGSVIYDPYGTRLAKGELLEEHMVVADVDFDLIEVARAKAPLLADLQGSWDTILKLAKE